MDSSVDCFFPLVACSVFSGTMKSRPQDIGLHARSSDSLLNSVSKVCSCGAWHVVSSAIETYIQPPKGKQRQWT